MVDCPQALVLPYFGIQPNSVHVLYGDTAHGAVVGNASTVSVTATVVSIGVLAGVGNSTVSVAAAVVFRQLSCSCRVK